MEYTDQKTILMSWQDEDDEDNVYRLPAPIPIKSEFGGTAHIERRVPTPVPKDDVKLNIHSVRICVALFQNVSDLGV